MKKSFARQQFFHSPVGRAECRVRTDHYLQIGVSWEDTTEFPSHQLPNFGAFSTRAHDAKFSSSGEINRCTVK
jgi:hypothetical protein